MQAEKSAFFICQTSVMPSAIVSNRMVYTGIMPLRHSRIIAAAASSVTAGLQMLAMDFCFMSLLFL